MVTKLDTSALNLFKDCPRCFWLDRIKGIKRPEGPFPSLPGGVDKVLKAHFDKHRAKGEVPKELDLKDVKLFADAEKMKVWTNNLKGIPYTDDEGNILRGAVDELLVNTKTNKLIVLDFKTRGYPCKEDTHEHYIDQLNIYNFLLRKNNYATEDYSYLLFFHPKEITEKGTIVFNIEPIKVPADIKKAEKLWKDALQCLSSKKEPKASEKCGYCSWKCIV